MSERAEGGRTRRSVRSRFAPDSSSAGASDTVIRTMGRWSSDIYRLYVRTCVEQCTDWTRRAGSTRCTAVTVDFDEVDDY